MTNRKTRLANGKKASDLDTFLQAVAATPAVRSGEMPGRLIFAIDATASREPTWDQACHIQARMFAETAALGGLEIQLCYYRGYGDFHSLPWLSDSEQLLRRMTGVHCLAGKTQIARVLQHAVAEARKTRVNALVFVGDCMEEDVDQLCRWAGELGLLGVPAFLFQEGGDPIAERAFKQIARITKGAYCPFDANSAKQLLDLLRAVAVYAAGGSKALADFGRGAASIVRQLCHQISRE